MNVINFKEKPILGILRGADGSIIEPLVETVIEAGLGALEITMNTAGAPELIRKTKQIAAGRLTLGAGTVLSMPDLKLALKSGATFIVMPVLVKEVMAFCVKKKIPVFPGALTPGEIYQAWNAGATMVKVFPAKFFGPEYFRELKGPFNKIELLACGGVTSENLKNYFVSGASAVSFGASIFRKDWLGNKDFKAIGRAVKDFIDTYGSKNNS
ncbi:MAG: bifunctional 4-hydroxy-2-oxoglutarate aldolase/2-dehydro-3-deoxy-phosphogluconate aldolase [Candidatus Omnitrophica bacterium]|nr:bifunctional 4-hydroxy-2-oxoglutarate aldolase/2-dehydro-3-deoxy-phosphogluconate aldolase [Candidatus Omnitrophota bacterium]MBU4303315.1 bifunctional 4-hydroxy-2-oxoglutarate aldolase/2-dehydro-3-deoxy-phosphogluconate aldolase [Candidatus Omnitrophota bacterium]MBU4468645.1 bifunctional 4-hydroxy-2-oxoglutarate aldolase/2-dehydro-3-deoxy-phosphogluconate aldolase [Candidatus Omnitrophota bacterium]MCG2707536.1 bifunctional 4-hydroxy-2-oxoglutarate aldolase/2-dehydro-3-deoxy-phosphogluconat